MSKLRRVVIEEFRALIKIAQEYHKQNNEPIPEMPSSCEGAVASCLNTPFQTFAGQLLYKGFHRKAAVLFYLLCKNHALPNGNKRMACMTFFYFCMINRYDLKLPPDRFYNMAMLITKSDAAQMDLVIQKIELMVRTVAKRK